MWGQDAEDVCACSAYVEERKARLTTATEVNPVEVQKAYREAMFGPIRYMPTPMQLAVHEDQHRQKQVSGGERGGKSFVGAKEALLHIPTSTLIWIVAQEYATCRTEFEYLMGDCLKLGLLKAQDISFPKEGACQFKTINGCKVETKSADDFRKLGMVAPDFILVCEGAQISFDAYLRLRGRIAEKRGSMVMTGTMEGSLGWWPEYIKRGQAPDKEFRSFILPSWSNELVYPKGEHEITLMNGEVIKNVNKEIYDLWCETPLDVFMERYGAVPQPVAGIIMREFSNPIHVGDYEYDPNIPVEIAVDPGYGGAYAVLAIQIKESIPYVVDEIYLQGYTTEDIITIMHQKPWGHAVTDGAIDIAAKQHQAMAAPIEVWKEKAGITLKCAYVEVDEGINLMRSFLKVNPVTNRPKVYFNHSCKGIIAECGGGKSPVQGGGAWVRDVNTNKIVDKWNHSAKALIYWLVNRYGYAGTKQNRKQVIMRRY